MVPSTIGGTLMVSVVSAFRIFSTIAGTCGEAARAGFFTGTGTGCDFTCAGCFLVPALVVILPGHVVSSLLVLLIELAVLILPVLLMDLAVLMSILG